MNVTCQAIIVYLWAAPLAATGLSRNGNLNGPLAKPLPRIPSSKGNLAAAAAAAAGANLPFLALHKACGTLMLSGSSAQHPSSSLPTFTSAPHQHSIL
eukprot:scaffold275979_cov19-Tisochrysis_lutea.AAC.1